MSEPIQSISQGNYILHNIDAKKLYVQEPLFTANSGDAVYVGWRPDETVLFSSNDGGVTAGTFNENLTNFEYVDFYYNRTGTTSNLNLAGHSRIDMSYGVPAEIMCNAGLHTGPSAMFNTVEYFNLTNNTFTWNAGYNMAITKTGVSGSYIDTINFKNFGFTKVIGVNRKENA